MSAGGTTNGPDLVFTTGDIPPSVTGTSAGSVTTSGATVSGSVNPNRVATTYKVEYGPTAAYGSATTPVSAGSGSSDVTASVPITGLTSTTTYHARLVAVSSAGTTNGPDLVFTTGDLPPTVTGTSVGSVTTTGATISGNVNPNRVATTYRVEYGATAAYGSVTSSVAAGSGGSAVAVERAAHRALAVVDLPRAPGRGEHGRDDERPGSRLHDRHAGAVGRRQRGRVDHHDRRDCVRQRDAERGGDDLPRGVRHDGGLRVGDDAGVRRARAPARSRRAFR